MRWFCLLAITAILVPQVYAADPKPSEFGGKSIARWLDGLNSKNADERKKTTDSFVELVQQQKDLPRKIVDALLEEAVKDPMGLENRKMDLQVILWELGAPAAHALHRHLWNPRSEKRKFSLFLLAAMGQDAQPALPGVMEILEKDTDPRHFRMALYIAKQNPQPEVLKVLLGLLPNADIERQGHILDVLVQHDAAVESLLPLLRKWLTDKDNERRHIAIRALIDFHSDATPAMDDVMLLLQSKDESERMLGTMSLSQIGTRAKKAVPELEKLLKSDIPLEKSFATLALVRIAQHAQARTELERMLKDGEAAHRYRFAEALWRHFRSPFVPVVLKGVIEKSEGKDSLAIIDLAGKLGPSGAATIPALIKALDDSNVDVKIAASQAISRMGPAAAKAIEPLKANLKHRSDSVRYASIMALADLESPPFVVDQLVKLLDSSPEIQSFNILLRLGAMGDKAKAALPSIRKKQSDTDVSIRLSALETEWFITGAADIREKMWKELKNANPEEKHHASIIYGNLFPTYTDEVIDELIAMLWDDVRNSPTAEALGMLGPNAAKAVSALDRTLQSASTESRGRSAAAETLGLIGPKAKSAVPTLKKMLSDPEPRPRAYAALALIQIDNDRSGEAIIERMMYSRTYNIAIPALEAQWLLKKEEATITALIQQLRKATLGNEPRRSNHQFMATRALARIGPQAKAALPDLKDLLFDDDVTLRRYVRRAIEQIEGKK